MFVFHFSVSEPLCLVVVNVVGVPRARFQYLSVTGYCVNIMHVYVYALKIYTLSFCPPGPMHYFIFPKASNSFERISLSRALSVIIILYQYQVIIWTAVQLSEDNKCVCSNLGPMNLIHSVLSTYLSARRRSQASLEILPNRKHR